MGADLNGAVQLLQISNDALNEKTTPAATVTLRHIHPTPCSVGDDSTPPSLPPLPVGGKDQAGLLLLPPELFDEIVGYLDPAGTVLLALASKELAWRFLVAPPPAPPPLPCLLSTARPSGPPSPHPLEWTPWRALDDYIRAADDPSLWCSGSSSSGRSDRGHRARMLTTLDRDLPDVAYCHRCRRLHSPLLSFADPVLSSPTSGARSRPRPCARDREDPPWSRATRGILRCVAKRGRRGDSSLAPLLRQLGGTRTVCRAGVLTQVAERARWRAAAGGSGGGLLLRRRQTVASVDKTPLMLWLFGARLEAAPPGGDGGGDRNWGGSRSGGSSRNKDSSSIRSSDGGGGGGDTGLPPIHWICAHLTWMDRYAVFLDRLLRPLCARVRRGEDHPVHTHACFGREPFDPAVLPGHAVAERLRLLAAGAGAGAEATEAPGIMADGSPSLGAVRSCDRCRTDFSLDVAPLPAPFGWGFVLTTWTDPGSTLGSDGVCGKGDTSAPRTTHAGGQSRPRRSSDGGGGCRPGVYERFEGGRTSTNPAMIEPLDLERMRNYGWAERVAAAGNGGGSEKYVSWESAPAVDPLTGEILDPDPLEDEDY